MITRQDTIDAWRKIVNAVEPIGSPNKGLRNCAVHISDKFNGRRIKASYDPSKRRVFVSENLNRNELLNVLAHEACHVLERDEGLPVLTEQEMAELLEMVEYDDLKGTKAGSEAKKLMVYIYCLSKEWTNARKVNRYIDKIEECLDNLEDIKLDGEVEDKYFWNWFARNMDKLDEAVVYYQCGGHNEKWLYWRSELENALQIKIGVAY